MTPPFRIRVHMTPGTPIGAFRDKISSPTAAPPIFLSQAPSSGVHADVGPERPDPIALDDRALVERLRRGDARAFDEVYGALGGRIHGFLLRLSGRHDTAEGLAQETWLRFARSATTLDEDTRLAPWVFTIARNAFVSHRRWAMLDLSRVVTLGAFAESAPLPAQDPESVHERARAIALLERALQALPVASREVLLLVGVEGLDQEEVARILGVGYDALRQRLKRARDQLAAEMEKLEKQTKTAGRRVASGGTA